MLVTIYILATSLHSNIVKTTSKLGTRKRSITLKGYPAVSFARYTPFSITKLRGKAASCFFCLFA